MSSRVWGGICLATGTTVGAGMLAFPMVTIKIGLAWTAVLMCLCWLLMYSTAMLTCKVILNHSSITTIPDVAEQSKYRLLGIFGHIITIVLFYSLMTAYVVGGTSIIQKWAPQIKPMLLMIIFSCVFGSLIVGHIRYLDMVNRFLLGTLLVIFLVIINVLFPCCSFSQYQLPATNFMNLSQSIPIFFTAFCFHGSIPAIVKFVGPQIADLKKVFFWGSLIPLIIYLLWQGIASTAMLPEDHAFWIKTNNTNVGDFLALLGKNASFKNFTSFTSVFGALAIVTSYLGVGLGLQDYLETLANRVSRKLGTICLFLLTIFIPLGFAVLYPQGFLKALGFAAVMLCFLVIFLPVALMYLQKQNPKSMYSASYGILVVLILSGLIILGAEIFNNYYS